MCHSCKPGATTASCFCCLTGNILTSLPHGEVLNIVSATCELSVRLCIEITHVVGEMFAFLPVSGRAGEWEFSNRLIELFCMPTFALGL